ncbi:MAG: right-handed parallel beta-helix repeat-containing protein [Eubacteriales bacterium]|nr:right-handed parallel beta-helix repeat-containing protein [Eubacteriales bacterium]
MKRIRKKQRITAIVMAVIMVVGLLPVTMLSGLFVKTTKAATVQGSLEYDYEGGTLENTATSFTEKIEDGSNTPVATIDGYDIKITKASDGSSYNDYIKALPPAKGEGVPYDVAGGEDASAAVPSKGYFKITVGKACDLKLSLANNNTGIYFCIVRKRGEAYSFAKQQITSAKLTKNDNITITDAQANDEYYIYCSQKSGKTDVCEIRLFSVEATGTFETLDGPTPVSITAEKDSTDGTKVNITGGLTANNNGPKAYYVLQRSAKGDDDTYKDWEDIAKYTGADGTWRYQDTLSSSGTYKYRIVGRGILVEDKVVESATTNNEITYAAPLAAPEITLTSGAEKITVSWGATEADEYDVYVWEKGSQIPSTPTGKVNDGSNKYEAKNLTSGLYYNVKVVGKRNSDSAIKESEVKEARADLNADTSNAIPGMKITDTDAEGKLTVIREKGDITVAQPSTEGGFASTGPKNLSYVVLDNKIAAGTDFTVSADVTVNSKPNSSTGGIYVGAFTSVDSTCKPAAIGFRGVNSSVQDNVFYRYTTSYGAAKLGANSTALPYTLDTLYKVTLKRTGSSYSLTVSDKDGKEIATKTASDLDESLAGDVYVGFAIEGCSAKVQNLKIVKGEETVFDASKLTDSFTPFADNWDIYEGVSVSSAVVDNENQKITVTVNGEIGTYGAGSIDVTMKNSKGEVVDTKSITKWNSSSNELEFEPEDTDTYTFLAEAKRTGVEKTYKSDNKTVEGFIVKLATPIVSTRTAKESKIEVSWEAVKEATAYKVEYKAEGGEYKTLVESTTDLKATTESLTVGATYTFKVTAMRTLDNAKVSTEKKQTVADHEQFAWKFSAFGQGVSVDKNNISDKSKSFNGYSGDVNSGDGSVNVWSLGNKGKIVPASTDGLAFYYAQIPTSQNFTLTAKATVNKWTYTNGQEGFGLMAADAVGTNGDPSVFWNNSYMASVTKVEYYSAKDEETGEASIAQSGDKISMKLGIGSQEKVGVTKDNLSKLQDNDQDAINNQFKTTITTLESSQVAKDAGTYNIIGKYTNTDATFKGTTVAELETFKLTITKNNTGYFVSYTDEQGNTTTKKYYDTEALSKLDSDYVYAGFFASRTCDVTFSDVSLTTIDPSQDAPAEERPIEYIDVKLGVSSSSTASSLDYALKGKANVDGHVVVTKDSAVVAEADVKADVPFSFDTTLKAGSNKFVITLTPDENFVFGEYSKPTSYDVVEVTKSVTYAAFTGDLIYVSADATKAVDEAKANETYSQSAQINAGKGTKANPIDLYNAVSFARPGQKILLLPGEYNIVNNVLIPFGINGTADNNIYLMPAEEGTRVVLDFKGTLGEGMTICGNYWTVQNIDVTNSANGRNGIHICGSYNTLDAVNTYNNGNTGIQISRFSADQEKEDWPAYNTIKNCHSRNNADAGYEDADGFAAKLTCGKGNVFIGCVASNNADDGWDLFAKPETGAIPRVMIINCVAYANGFLEDGTNAGNGNGFKMGGSSMTGGHLIINSVAFDNKAKGIDSNSCPDNIVISCTSFNNGASNVALYTNDAKNTDYTAYGVLSYRTIYKDVADTLKEKGTQDKTKLYKATDYYWGSASGSANDSSILIEEDFVSIDTKADRTALTSSVAPLTGEMMLLASVVPVKYSELPFTRNSDGTINLNGLLMLSTAGRQKVGQGVGANALDKAPVLTAESQAILASILDTEEMSRLLSASQSLASETISRAGSEGALTGDTNNTFVWVILLIAAMAIVVGVAVYENKKKVA